MITNLLAQELRKVADKLDAGTCELSQDDALEIISTIANISLSQDESARYLNIPPTTFRDKVRKGIIPKGHKRRGLTERLWFLKDLRKVFHTS